MLGLHFQPAIAGRRSPVDHPKEDGSGSLRDSFGHQEQGSVCHVEWGTVHGNESTEIRLLPPSGHPLVEPAAAKAERGSCLVYKVDRWDEKMQGEQVASFSFLGLY